MCKKLYYLPTILNIELKAKESGDELQGLYQNYHLFASFLNCILKDWISYYQLMCNNVYVVSIVVCCMM